MYPLVSVVIPVYNSEATIEETLEHAKGLNREEYILGGERSAVKIKGFEECTLPKHSLFLN